MKVKRFLSYFSKPKIENIEDDSNKDFQQNYPVQEIDSKNVQSNKSNQNDDNQNLDVKDTEIENKQLQPSLDLDAKEEFLKRYIPSYNFDYGGDKPKKKEVKKIKVSEIEKHPFFKYIPIDILKKMAGNDEIDENNLVYNIEDLPIQLGDYVVCTDFDGITDKQKEFLEDKPYHKVRNITSKNYRYYQSGEPYIDIGYNIPFKMHRFKKVDRIVDSKHKILFLQFDLNIDLHGEKDVHNYFRNKKRMSELFPVLFKERLPDSYVEFAQYDDIYRLGPHFYVDNMKLNEYDFVFFGFMANFTTMVNMIINYLDKYKIPYLKYGTYKHHDNKAYEMDLVQSLGYPYIPSIMASRITGNLMKTIKEFGYPVIVKDIDLNRGEGVWKVDNMKRLMEIFSNGNRLMIIQKFIPNDGDYRVISIKNKVELVIKKERIPGTNEFRANVARGGRAVKGVLPINIIEMCEDVSRHLFCDIVGFDIIQDKVTKEYFIMETNSSPHFPTFSVISEIDIPGILVNYIVKKISL